MRATRLLAGVPETGSAEAERGGTRPRRQYARPAVSRLRLENVVRGSGGTKKDTTFPSTNPFPG
ncbi:MAG TPA: hypothetical protein VMS88_01830 [Terriglobales bacterium]|nr:hypothetical protein [Terriglobales bacterium]